MAFPLRETTQLRAATTSRRWTRGWRRWTWRAWAARTPPRSPAACASAWPSREPSSRSRKSSSSTSPPPASTPSRQHHPPPHRGLHRKFRFTAVMVSHEIPEIFEHRGTRRDAARGRHRGHGTPGGHPGLEQSYYPPVHPGRDRRRTRKPLNRGRRGRRHRARFYGGITHETFGARRGGRDFMLVGLLRARMASVRLGRVGARRPGLQRHRGLPLRRGAASRARPSRSPGSRSAGSTGSPCATSRRGWPYHQHRREAPGGRHRVDQDAGGSSGRSTSGSIRVARRSSSAERQDPEVEPPIDIEELISKYMFGKV